MDDPRTASRNVVHTPGFSARDDDRAAVEEESRVRAIGPPSRRSALNASGGADRSQNEGNRERVPGTGRWELEAVRCDEQEEPGRNGDANLHRLLRKDQ